MFFGTIFLIIPMLPFMNWLLKKDSRIHLREAFRIVPDRIAAKQSIERSFIVNPAGASSRMLKEQRKLLTRVDEVADEMKLA